MREAGFISYLRFYFTPASARVESDELSIAERLRARVKRESSRHVENPRPQKRIFFYRWNNAPINIYLHMFPRAERAVGLLIEGCTVTAKKTREKTERGREFPTVVSD